VTGKIVLDSADAAVTDDRAFLKALREAGLPYTTPAFLVVDLARAGALPAPPEVTQESIGGGRAAGQEGAA
jgi:hypothetical protein